MASASHTSLSPSNSSSRDLRAFRQDAPLILPSILQCDYGNLEREIARLEEAGARALHLDVMDGNFVPNLSFGFPVIESIRRRTSLPLDVHLMISNPTEYIHRYVDAGADLLTVHAEVLKDPCPVLEEIRSLGVGAGLAINPPTALGAISDSLPYCDLVLVMSVMPGFGGQTFDAVALEKLQTLRADRSHSFILEIDGGVNSENIRTCVESGADFLVVGSAITGQEDYKAGLKDLSQLAQGTV